MLETWLKVGMDELAFSNLGINTIKQAKIPSAVAGAYTEATKAAAEANQDFVMGYISQTPNAWPGGPGSPGRFLQSCFLLLLGSSWLSQYRESSIAWAL